MKRTEPENPYRLASVNGTWHPRREMAEWTGLEPAAFRVTGGRYNQLNYHSVVKTNVNVKIKGEPLEIQQLYSVCLHLMHKTS